MEIIVFLLLDGLSYHVLVSTHKWGVIIWIQTVPKCICTLLNTNSLLQDLNPKQRFVVLHNLINLSQSQIIPNITIHH